MIIIKKMETDAEIKGKAYVHYKSWHEAYSELIDHDYLKNVTMEKCEMIAYKWPDNIFVAKDEEKVIGFIGYGKYRDEQLPDTGEIFAVYVLKEYYGKGVGQALMREALKKLPYSQIALWVLKGNVRAIRFYEKCGFRFDGCEQEIRLGSPASEQRMLLNRS